MPVLRETGLNGNVRKSTTNYRLGHTRGTVGCPGPLNASRPQPDVTNVRIHCS